MAPGEPWLIRENEPNGRRRVGGQPTGDNRISRCHISPHSHMGRNIAGLINWTKKTVFSNPRHSMGLAWTAICAALHGVPDFVTQYPHRPPRCHWSREPRRSIGPLPKTTPIDWQSYGSPMCRVCELVSVSRHWATFDATGHHQAGGCARSQPSTSCTVPAVRARSQPMERAHRSATAQVTRGPSMRLED